MNDVIIIVYTTLMLLMLLLLLIKNLNTFRVHTKVSDAIFAYNLAVIDRFYSDYEIRDRFDIHKMTIEYDVMEDYSKTLLRFWDWGCTRIVPRDTYELIKPYL